MNFKDAYFSDKSLFTYYQLFSRLRHLWRYMMIWINVKTIWDGMIFNFSLLTYFFHLWTTIRIIFYKYSDIQKPMSLINSSSNIICYNLKEMVDLGLSRFNKRRRIDDLCQNGICGLPQKGILYGGCNFFTLHLRWLIQVIFIWTKFL